MRNSEGMLHVLTRPDKPQPAFGVIGIARSVKPWTEWVIIMLAAPGITEITATQAEIKARVEELIGDDTVEVKVKRVSKWVINECYAERYSKGNVFCLGDAVHRHPPHNGLGSNTCIQDAYNLAWKLAYVLKGHADSSLLSSFNDERQPVGKYIVGRANDTRRLHAALYTVLGVFKPSVEERVKALAELKEDSPQGVQRRAAFRKAVDDLEEDRNGLGGEMNQLYRSQAIYTKDEQGDPPLPESPKAATLYYQQSTYPGSRLPHAWLSKPVEYGPRGRPISTHDLAGHGIFTLFTGIGGKDAWRSAATKASSALEVEVASYSIGWGQDFEDIFFQWAERRGVEEKGVVLVRPDRSVAWRCQAFPQETTCDDALLTVITWVLGR